MKIKNSTNHFIELIIGNPKDKEPDYTFLLAPRGFNANEVDLKAENVSLGENDIIQISPGEPYHE